MARKLHRTPGSYEDTMDELLPMLSIQQHQIQAARDPRESMRALADRHGG